MKTLLASCLLCFVAHAAANPFKIDELMPDRLPCASAAVNDKLTLMDVVNLALCANPQTREVWASTRVQAAQLGVAKASYLPDSNLGASEVRNWAGSLNGTDRHNIALSLNYLLFDFGTRAANAESARQMLLAAQATQSDTVQSVLMATVKAFYAVQSNLASVQANQESEKVARASLEAAQARHEAGSATPLDKLQAQTALSQASLNRIRAEGEMRNAQGALANLLGWDAHRPVQLAAAAQVPTESAALKNFERDVAALVEQAKTQRADLQAAAAQLKAAEASVEAARAANKPSVSLSMGINQSGGDGGNSRNSSIGVNVSVPLFSGFKPTYQVRAAEAQVEAKTAQLDKIRLQVALEVWTAYQNLITANQALIASNDLLNSAQQAEQVASGRYQHGVGNILDVLSAQNAWAQARQQAIQAIYNWNVGRVALAQAMGNLDAKLLAALPDGR